MVRLAFANGFKLHTFYSGLLGYKGPVWNRDIDRHPSEKLIFLLSSQTGQSARRLHQLTLASFESVLFESLPSIGNGSLILPVGVFHRVRRRTGMQYCPLCLNSDSVPFYRKTWRLAVHVLCPVHQCVMEEHCPSCLAPIAYHRHGVGREREVLQNALWYCSHCGFDLRLSLPRELIWPDENSRLNLLKIISACNGGQWNCGGMTPSFSLLFFKGLRILLGLIHGRHGHRILPGLATSIGIDARLPLKGSHMEFEFLNVGDRLQLLLMVSWLLLDWPSRFVELCRAGRLTRSRVSDDVNSLPFWLAAVVNEFLDNRIYQPSDQEVIEAVRYLQATHKRVTVAALRDVLGLGNDRAASERRKWRGLCKGS